METQIKDRANQGMINVHPSDFVYRSISDAIIAHKLAPGTRLPEEALAATFNVSRTIIREVIQRLALERMVMVQRNRGAHVSRPKIHEAREIFSARRLIETGCIPEVINRANKDSITRLINLINEERNAQLRHQHSESIRLSSAFHVELIGICGNTIITEILEKLMSRSSLIIAVYGSSNSFGCSCGEHSQLVDLITSKRIDESVEWLSMHFDFIESSLNFKRPTINEPDFKEIFKK